MTRTNTRGQKRRQRVISGQQGRDEETVPEGRAATSGNSDDTTAKSSTKHLEDAHEIDTAELGAEYDVGSSPLKRAIGFASEDLDDDGPDVDTAELGAEYDTGSSPLKEAGGLALEDVGYDGVGYDTAEAAADYAVGSSQGVGGGAPAEHGSPTQDTAHLAMDYFVDEDSMQGVHSVNIATQAEDVPRMSSEVDIDLEHKGLPNGDVTLVEVRKRCREALLQCYLQEKLAIQGLMDCRRRLTDYISLLQDELDSRDNS
ncbi:other/FunK1 protein kinase [Coprinopsis cinerea AmutBmut pab1-1]|nr:other/FunK1 protein kinase [Coprinopsis cinerea AmutBmut pab1-1]